MRTTGKYIRHPDGRVEPCNELLEWANWFETACRTVARTEISEGVSVSTVFLGMDHSFVLGDHVPVLFETMVFGSELDGEQERYMSEEDALYGHSWWVARVQGTISA